MANSITVVSGGPGVYYLVWQTGRSVRRMVVEMDEQDQGPCFVEQNLTAESSRTDAGLIACAPVTPEQSHGTFVAAVPRRFWACAFKFDGGGANGSGLESDHRRDTSSQTPISSTDL